MFFLIRTLPLVPLLVVLPTATRSEIPPVVDLSLTEANVTVTGPSGEKVGWSVSGGDFNGDSVQDLAFTWRRVVGETTPPRITILWSAQSLPSAVNLASTNEAQSTITAINGDGSNQTSLATGDFNGDGIDDLALGVVNNSAQTNYDGKIYLIFGTRGFPDDIDLAIPDVPTALVKAVVGSAGWLGHTLASGDVNNDGRDDLIAPAWAYWPGGRVYVVYGQSSLPAVIDLAISGPQTVRIVDAYLNQGTGTGVASDDVNNDNYDDILIGSPGTAEGFFQGTVSLVFGGPALPTTLTLSDNTPGVKRFYGSSPDGQLGHRVALGDVNGDGWRDIVMAAYTADPNGCSDCGEIDIVYWSANLPDAVYMGTTGIDATRLIGQGYSTLHGINMVVGEVDGDPFADVVLKKEPDNSLNPPERRAVLIAHGASALPDTIFLRDDAAVNKIIAAEAGDDHGRGLAVVDLDANGVDDLCIGAPLSSAGGNGGKVRVFFDCFVTTAAPTSPSALVLFPNYPNPFSQQTSLRYSTPSSGSAVVTIFDVNGVKVRTVVTSPSLGPSVTWDGRDDRGQRLPSGVYFCRLAAEGQSVTRKIVLVR